MRLSTLLAVSSLTLLAACGAASSGSEFDEDLGTAGEQSPPAMSVVSVADLSPTHRVQLVSDESGDVTVLVEDFDPDVDRSVVQPAEGESAVDLYLESLEAHGVQARDPADLIGELEAPSEIGTTSAALCNEPSWDWDADEAWFERHWCDSGYQYCRSLRSSHAYERKSKYFKAAAFAQSHCSSATYRVGYQYSTGFLWTTTVIGSIGGGTLEPRRVRSHYGTASRKIHWNATISSDNTGNVTGMSAFSWD